MYTYSEKPKRDMAMPQNPLAELLAKVYRAVVAVIFYGAAIGIVAMVSYVLTALVLRVLAQ